MFVSSIVYVWCAILSSNLTILSIETYIKELVQAKNIPDASRAPYTTVLGRGTTALAAFMLRFVIVGEHGCMKSPTS